MDYAYDFLSVYWPGALVAIPAIGACWVCFIKIAKLTPNKKDDAVVDRIEKDSLGKRVSDFLKSKSPIK